MNLPQIPADKAQHFCYGAAAGFSAAALSHIIGHPEFAGMAAITSATLAGATKEIVDHVLNLRAARAGLLKPHSVTMGDFVVTILGGVAVGAL